MTQTRTSRSSPSRGSRASPAPARPSGAAAQLRARWNTLQPRERLLLGGGGALLALTLAWLLLLSPALNVLATAPVSYTHLTLPKTPYV